MGAPRAIAAVHGRFPSPVTILLVLAGIAYVMWSRMQGQPLQAKRLLVLPAVFVVIGIGDLTGKHAHYKECASVGRCRSKVGICRCYGRLGLFRMIAVERIKRAEASIRLPYVAPRTVLLAGA